MKFLEKVLALMALLGVIMNLFSISGGGAIIALSLICLGVLYLLGGVLLFNDVKLRACFRRSSYNGITTGHIVASLITSGILFISIIAVLGFLMYGEKKQFILYAATTINFAFTVVIAILQSIKHQPFYRNILSRTFVVFIVMACLVFTPSKYLEKEKNKVISYNSHFYGK